MKRIPKIQIIELQKSYKNRKDYCVPLSKCNLEVYNNDFFVILGESGSGKSTLLRIICGLEEYDFGSVLIDGINSTEISQINKNMSLVSQNIVLFPHKTVYENLITSLTLNKFSKEDKLKRIEELSNMFGLDMLLTRKPKELSGGQQQRVAVARAMAKRPNICLFDEPLASLDPIYHQDLINMFKKIHKETLGTFIYSTHNQQEAFQLASKIGLLHNRKFEQIGVLDDFLNHPATEYVASYFTSLFVFMVDVKYESGYLVNKDLDIKIKVDYKTYILKKYQNKTLKLAVRKSDLILNVGKSKLPVVGLTSNMITIVFGEKEIAIPFDNELDQNIKEINFSIRTERPVLFFEGKNIFND